MPSVPLAAYQFFNGISKFLDVTLVTHERNRQALEKVRIDEEIVYIPESTLTTNYYRLVAGITSGKRGVN